MNTLIDNLMRWLVSNEDEHLEFKEAKNSFEFEELVKYCVALANEGGGKFILGVTDKRPRKIVGTRAFDNLVRARSGVTNRLHLRIDADEIAHPDGRVVVFHIPSRPIGMPIHYDGRYFMRSGENLVPMTPDLLKRIFDEAGPDFTSEICSRAVIADLDTGAIEDFRNRWVQKSNNEALRGMTLKQLLGDAELIRGDGVTYAALILFGKREALGRLLAQSEVVFEYRSGDATGAAQQREDFREGFFCFYEKLWQLINLRNDRQHYQDGLFVWDIPTFNEAATREAILNSVSHRDYRMAGSVFIRQYPRRLEIVSPGGLPEGITLDNILWEQAPRNRRLAEAFARCGLVERSGQGMNRIFESCIRESKPKPDFTHTDAHHVWLTIHGTVQHTTFLRFLEKVGADRLTTFTTQDFMVVDLLFRDAVVPDSLKGRIPWLIESGIVEQVGRGRGVRYLLARQFYELAGKKGIYTRRRGLDRETNKTLLLKHIDQNQVTGARMEELRQVLSGHSRSQIQILLREMAKEGKVHVHGLTRGARWYPGMISSNCNHEGVESK
ncbi:MAG: ATP-binding protein [bacterium]